MNTTDDNQAIAAYAILARDIEDFIDYVPTMTPAARKLLHQMLTTPNPAHDQRTTELNELGASLFKP